MRARSANLVLPKLRAVCLFAGQGAAGRGASGAGARRRGCPGRGFPARNGPGEQRRSGEKSGEMPSGGGQMRGSAIAAILGEVHSSLSGVSEGEVATYIPQLSRARPEWFGIAVATVDGRVYEAGDAAQPFTIQSVSKPFLYGYALREYGQRLRARQGRRGADRRGLQLHRARQGEEPAVQPDGQFRGDRRRGADEGQGSGRSGADRTCSRSSGSSPGGGWRSTGRSMPPRMRPGTRNRAIAYMMLNSGMIERDSGGGARGLFPAMLGAGDGAGPRAHGGDAGQRRRPSR